MSTAIGMKANLLFEYGGYGWCKHGTVLTYQGRDGIKAADTYWGNGYPSGAVELDELTRNGKFIADLDEFRPSNRDEYYRYAESDRVHIPIGGGSERWLVRTLARPDKQNAMRQIAEELIRWEGKKHSAEWHIGQLLKEQESFTQASNV